MLPCCRACLCRGHRTKLQSLAGLLRWTRTAAATQGDHHHNNIDNSSANNDHNNDHYDNNPGTTNNSRAFDWLTTAPPGAIRAAFKLVKLMAPRKLLDMIGQFLQWVAVAATVAYTYIRLCLCMFVSKLTNTYIFILNTHTNVIKFSNNLKIRELQAAVQIWLEKLHTSYLHRKKFLIKQNFCWIFCCID